MLPNIQPGGLHNRMNEPKREPVKRRSGVGVFERAVASVNARLDQVNARLGAIEKSVSSFAGRPSMEEVAVQTDRPPEEEFYPGVGFGVTVVRPRRNGSSYPPLSVPVGRAPSSTSLDVNFSEATAPGPAGPCSPAVPEFQRPAVSDSSTLPPSSEDEEPAARSRRSQLVRRRRTPAPPGSRTRLPVVEVDSDPGWEPRPGDRRMPAGERERRVKSGLCLYCASDKHYIAKCPVRPVLPDHVKTKF